MQRDAALRLLDRALRHDLHGELLEPVHLLEDALVEQLLEVGEGGVEVRARRQQAGREVQREREAAGIGGVCERRSAGDAAAAGDCVKVQALVEAPALSADRG